ncbi:hypothetical protein O7606_13720 [Micromonospora sp. WMMD882]|uniref:hypothetical protein n=1 Tax=Micromonospora sp. WMMD882 TaxID=3015151 RepID=UPI00248B22F1|nr:hypothetical protein [Micromonospora sp. WMMD882]WBB77354.1 hypothetical protein O7606_13720 [Micromonospora sp. WMMD882]
MSVLRPGDEKYHYSDGSHRWIPPDPDYDQVVWEEQVRQHQRCHLGGELPQDNAPTARSPEFRE